MKSSASQAFCIAHRYRHPHPRSRLPQESGASSTASAAVTNVAGADGHDHGDAQQHQPGRKRSARLAHYRCDGRLD